MSTSTLPRSLLGQVARGLDGQESLGCSEWGKMGRDSRKFVAPCRKGTICKCRLLLGSGGGSERQLGSLEGWQAMGEGSSAPRGQSRAWFLPLEPELPPSPVGEGGGGSELMAQLEEGGHCVLRSDRVCVLQALPLAPLSGVPWPR